MLETRYRSINGSTWHVHISTLVYDALKNYKLTHSVLLDIRAMRVSVRLSD